MFENLNQSYPFNNNFKHNLRTITLVSMGFMFISLYFQPFGIDFLSSRKDGYFVLVLGLVSASTFFFNTLILPGLFPKIFESARWTIRKELVWNMGMFATLIVGFSLTALLFNIASMASLTVFRAGALALLPLVLFNFMNYNSVLKSKVAQVIDSGRHWFAEEHTKSAVQASQQIRIESDNGKEFVEVELKNIVLVQSAGNYIEIYFKTGDRVQRQIIRQTLQKVALSLDGFSTIKKCHRCCLVNTDHIIRIGGSSPNYSLESSGLDFRIPVSRHKVAEFRKLLSKASISL